MDQLQMSIAPVLSRPSRRFTTRSLSSALGAEIIGLDLREQFDARTVADLRDAWHENLIILLRDQTLSDDDQVRFASYFGPPAKTHRFQHGTHPSIMLISNIREDGKLIGALPDGEMQFHTDQCHQERPAMASMLYAIEIPSVGGNTMFANGYRAYETLPARIRARIDGARALNAYDYDSGATIRSARPAENAPAFVHPVVRVHPGTGRRALYVNRLMTRRIEGMEPQESEELLNFLFDHQERPEFVYEHVWRPGDLLMWDNRCALHARTDFSAAERRLMRRVTILGERPVGV